MPVTVVEGLLASKGWKVKKPEKDDEFFNPRTKRKERAQPAKLLNSTV